MSENEAQQTAEENKEETAAAVEEKTEAAEATAETTEAAEEVKETPAEPEEISYHAVEKEGEISAIWEMQGKKHIRTISARSGEGQKILSLFTSEIHETDSPSIADVAATEEDSPSEEASA